MEFIAITSSGLYLARNCGLTICCPVPGMKQFCLNGLISTTYCTAEFPTSPIEDRNDTAFDPEPQITVFLPVLNASRSSPFQKVTRRSHSSLNAQTRFRSVLAGR